ncbi:hypothetical protein FOE74_20805 [Rufibacter glacialis]|nr:hypothetical protein FOE74_20805 [Rufibacter glacialis]
MKKAKYFIAISILIAACTKPGAKEETKLDSRSQTAGVADYQHKGTTVAEASENIGQVVKVSAEEGETPSSDEQGTKAYVFESDSSIHLTANIRQEHRIFGYAKPDTTSNKLLLLSVFTDDVEKNPFKCELGAYYETDGMKQLKLKYLQTRGDFIEAVAIDHLAKSRMIYFEKKWIEFE